MTSVNLSRRAIVAGAASVPALAVPAIASMENSDAEELGAELEQLEQEWLALTLREDKRHTAQTVACERAGLPPKEFKDFADHEECIAYHKKRGAVWYDGKDEERPRPTLKA
jgi:hypothetical protein